MAMQKAAIAAALNQILQLCRSSTEGCPGKALETVKPIEICAEALNVLLKKGQLLAFQKNGELWYKEQSREQAEKLKNLTPEDKIVYQAVEATRNDGIWSRDLRKETKLQQAQIQKALKKLEDRNLIKQVPTTQKNRKIYMLYDLKPSEKITGGVWYSDQEFDAEFVETLKKQCLQFVLKQGVTTVDHVANMVRKSGLSKDDLNTNNFKQIMDNLVLDGELEEVVSNGTMQFNSIPAGTHCYRLTQSRGPGTLAFTNMPCGVCPVIHQCTPDGVISPKTCIYYKEWLNF